MMNQGALANLPPDLLQAFGIDPNNPNPSPLALTKLEGAANPPSPLTGIVQQMESGGRNYNPDGSPLTSSAGAQYAMQTLPSTQRDPGFGVTPARDNSAEEANRVGRDYLSAMQQRYADPAKALAAYNAGPGRVDQAIAKGGDQWASLLPDETKKYVAKGIGQLPPTATSAPSDQYASADPSIMSDAQVDNTISVELPDGTVVHDVPANITKAQLMAKLQANGHDIGDVNAGSGVQPDTDPTLSDNFKKYFKDIHAIQKTGIRDAKDLVQGNYETIGEPRLDKGTKTSALADLLFPAGSDGSFTSALGNISNIKPSDASGAYLEKISGSAPGKLTSAIFNTGMPYVGKAVTGLNNYISDQTGIHPDNLALGEMVLGAKLPGALKEAGDTMTAGTSALSNIAKDATGTILDAPIVQKALAPVKSLVADESGSGLTLPTKKEVTAPETIHSAIIDSYETQKAKAGSYYDKAGDLASEIPIKDSPSLTNNLQGVVDDIKSNPFHEGAAALPKLNDYLSKLKGKTDSGKSSILDASGKNFETPSAGLTAKDLVDLKKTLNASFNPKRFQDAKGTAYGELSSLVDSSLNTAAKENPKFGAAYDVAKKQWLNNVEKPFNSKVISKYFQPEDYYDRNNIKTGLLERPSDDTAARASALVDNIKTPTQLDAIRRVLPDDLAKEVSNQVYKNIGKNTGRLNAAKNLAFGVADIRPHGLARTATNAADVIAGPKLTPKTKALIKATKQPSPKLTNY